MKSGVATVLVALLATLVISKAETRAAAVESTATPLRGPVVSIADFCRTLPHGQRCYGRADEDDAPVHAKNVPAPYLAVETFVAGNVDGKRLYIAIQLAEGWFIYASPDESIGDIANVELAVRKQPDGRAVIVSRSVQSWLSTDESDRRELEHCTQYLTLCGVGASGKPSCMAPLAVAGGMCNETDRVATKWQWRLREHFGGPTIELKAAGKITEVDGKAAVGVHALEFK